MSRRKSVCRKSVRRKDVRRKNVPVPVNLPTPTNLHQHTYLPMSTYQHIPTHVNLPSSTYLPLPILKYQYRIATDPGASIGLVIVIGVISTSCLCIILSQHT